MISVFDIEKLEALLKDFYAIARIRITVFDENRNELVAYPKKVAPYCAVIRGTREGLDACMRCDREACERAAGKHATQVYRCHAGLTEAVTPLYVGRVLVGYLMFGHVFSYWDREEGINRILRCCGFLGTDEDALEVALRDAEVIREEQVRSAAHILHAVASYLIMEHMADIKEDQLSVRLDAYLNTHFTRDVSVKRLCEVLGIGRTQLYKLSSQLYGAGIAQHVRELRMAYARDLLRDRKELSLQEVAGMCGYEDYNYFISVFSAMNGTSPGKYRQIT